MAGGVNSLRNEDGGVSGWVDAIDAEFSAVGVIGRLHVSDIDGPAAVAIGSDEPVVLASVVKVLVAVEFARQVVAGQLDPTERVRVRAGDRLRGGGAPGRLGGVGLRPPGLGPVPEFL